MFNSHPFFRRALSACLLCIAACAVHARDVDSLYAARVTVADRSPAELARGAAAALREVLVKLTGDRRAPQGPAGALARRASELMLQYGYRQDAAGGALELAAEFDQRALDAELAALGVPVWGKERPETTVWLIVDEREGRRLVGGDEPGRYAEALTARATRRGVPLLFPLMDIEESQHLLYAGDWNGLATTALALSTRYGTAASVVGYLRESAPGLWEVSWRLRVADEDYEWRQEGDLVELVLEDGVDAIADSLARRFADPGVLAQAEQVAIAVEGVRTAADYARLANYLDALDTVAELFVSALAGDTVRVRLNTRGGRAALAQSIAFGSVLAPVAGRSNVYQLLP